MDPISELSQQSRDKSSLSNSNKDASISDAPIGPIRNRPDISFWFGVGCCVLILALLLSIRSCMSERQSYRESLLYINSVKDTLKYSKDSLEVSKKSIITNSDLFKRILDERDDLKSELVKLKIRAANVSSVSNIVSHTVITSKDSIVIQHDTIPCLGFKSVAFEVDSSYYRIAGYIRNRDILFSKIDFPDSLAIITSRKHFLFKPSETTIVARHSNKYIRTTGLENFIIRENKKWWEMRGIGFVAGVVGGWLLFKK